MKAYLIFALTVMHWMLIAQPTTLTILGRVHYVSHPATYIFKISEVSHPHAPKDYKQLNASLDSLGVIYNVDSIRETWRNPDIQKTIDYYTYSKDHFELLMSVISKMNMGGFKNYLFSKNNFMVEDSLAYLAYQDACRRAEILARSLGKKIVHIHNIDDQVDRYYFYIETFPELRFDPIKRDLMVKFIEVMSRSNSEESHESERKGEYALWVTFDMK